MAEQTQESQAAPTQEVKQSDKEFNFRALEAKYQKQLEQERTARLEAEKKAEEALSRKKQEVEEEDESDPYVDHRRLKKSLTTFGQSTQSEIQKAMELAKQKAKEEIKQEMWLEQNPDFYDVLSHAEKFAQRSPNLAKSILAMPEGFERQKLVYENIKEMGLHKPEQKQSSVQEKIDLNKKSPYYQPSGMGSAPYAAAGDFSQSGQKNAYLKMKELQKRLGG